MAVFASGCATEVVKFRFFHGRFYKNMSSHESRIREQSRLRSLTLLPEDAVPLAALHFLYIQSVSAHILCETG